MKKRNDQIDRLDPLIREAVAWIARLKSGEATLADAEQLMEWRARGPAQEGAYRYAVKCWQTIGHALGGDRPTPGGGQRRRTRPASRA